MRKIHIENAQETECFSFVKDGLTYTGEVTFSFDVNGTAATHDDPEDTVSTLTRINEFVVDEIYDDKGNCLDEKDTEEKVKLLTLEFKEEFVRNEYSLE